MTLPMSRIELAPVSRIASATASSTAASSSGLRQEFPDNSLLGALAFGQLHPASFLIGGRGFLALLDHLGEEIGDLLAPSA